MIPHPPASPNLRRAILQNKQHQENLNSKVSNFNKSLGKKISEIDLAGAGLKEKAKDMSPPLMRSRRSGISITVTDHDALHRSISELQSKNGTKDGDRLTGRPRTPRQQSLPTGSSSGLHPERSLNLSRSLSRSKERIDEAAPFSSSALTPLPPSPKMTTRKSRSSLPVIPRTKSLLEANNHLTTETSTLTVESPSRRQRSKSENAISLDKQTSRDSETAISLDKQTAHDDSPSVSDQIASFSKEYMDIYECMKTTGNMMVCLRRMKKVSKEEELEIVDNGFYECVKKKGDIMMCLRKTRSTSDLTAINNNTTTSFDDVRDSRYLRIPKHLKTGEE